MQAVFSLFESKGAYLSVTCLSLIVRHYQFWIRHVYQFHHSGVDRYAINAWHYSDAARLYNYFLWFLSLSAERLFNTAYCLGYLLNVRCYIHFYHLCNVQLSAITAMIDDAIGIIALA